VPFPSGTPLFTYLSLILCILSGFPRHSGGEFCGASTCCCHVRCSSISVLVGLFYILSAPILQQAVYRLRHMGACGSVLCSDFTTTYLYYYTSFTLGGWDMFCSPASLPHAGALILRSWRFLFAGVPGDACRLHTLSVHHYLVTHTFHYHSGVILLVFCTSDDDVCLCGKEVHCTFPTCTSVHAGDLSLHFLLLVLFRVSFR